MPHVECWCPENATILKLGTVGNNVVWSWCDQCFTISIRILKQSLNPPCKAVGWVDTMTQTCH